MYVYISMHLTKYFLNLVNSSAKSLTCLGLLTVKYVTFF